MVVAPEQAAIFDAPLGVGGGAQLSLASFARYLLGACLALPCTWRLLARMELRLWGPFRSWRGSLRRFGEGPALGKFHG